jgi:ribosomal protein S18 acetylase RimI-like enzyme
VDTVEIRPAGAGDAREILDLQRAAYRIEGERYGDFSLPPLTETVDDLARALRTHVVLVARRSTRVATLPTDPIVGTVRARVAADTAHIGRMSVLPALHGRGIGRQLLEAIEQDVAPVRCYALFTGHRSERNLRMYERAGYRRVRTERQSDAVMLIHLEKMVAPNATHRAPPV